MDASDTPLVEVRQLRKEFPGEGSARPVVADVSFAIRRGETFGLVGRSAAGKSTIGRMIVGLEKPTAGDVLFAGKVISRQCQRLGIARALASRPEFVFLDEPVSALDVSIQAQILNLLKELQERLRLTYLFVANNLNVMRFICDRLAVIEDGHLVEHGDNEEIFARPRHPATRRLLDSVTAVKL